MDLPDGRVVVHEGSGYVLYYQASGHNRSLVVRLRPRGEYGRKGFAGILQRAISIFLFDHTKKSYLGVTVRADDSPFIKSFLKERIST